MGRKKNSSLNKAVVKVVKLQAKLIPTGCNKV